MENKPCAVFQKIIIYLVRGISWAMIVRMRAVKIEYNRNVVLRKVVVIASVIEPVWVVLVIVSIIKLNVRVFLFTSSDRLWSSVLNLSEPMRYK